MNVADAPERSSGQSKGRDEFTAQIADEAFEFREVSFRDRKITGAQVAEAAGAHPVSDFVVLQQLETLELETLRPTELADVTKLTRFFVIRGDAIYPFTVDGLSMVWPLKTVTGLTVKRLVGKDDDEAELLLEREDTPDKVINDDDEGSGLQSPASRSSRRGLRRCT